MNWHMLPDSCRRSIVDELQSAIALESCAIHETNILLKSHLTPYLLQKSIQWAIQQRRTETSLHGIERELALHSLSDDFVTRLSHEFRNPLSMVRVFVELLQNQSIPITTDRQQHYLELIQDAIAQMTRLLDDVLLLSDSELNRIRYEPTQFNLEIFCQELIEAIQLNNHFSHEILFACDGDVQEVKMDQNLLRHILNHLLANAAKYSPYQNHIEFLLSSDGKGIMLRIKDYGIGIPDEALPYLFSPFYRAINVKGFEGSGLGLSIVKKCVILHQGTISIISQPNCGTTVTVILPRQEILPTH